MPVRIFQRAALWEIFCLIDWEGACESVLESALPSAATVWEHVECVLYI